jgi:hypothetical protein
MSASILEVNYDLPRLKTQLHGQLHYFRQFKVPIYQLHLFECDLSFLRLHNVVTATKTKAHEL